MDAEFPDSEKSELVGILRSLKAALDFESVNCAHGVTPSVWEEKVSASPGPVFVAAMAPESPPRGKQDKETRHESQTLSLFDGSVSAKGTASPSMNTGGDSQNNLEQADIKWLRLSSREAASELEKLTKEIGPACNRCPLGSLGRSKVVFGVGDPVADILFVGEGPGEDEDRQGEPFVGRAGQLLTKMILAMGLQRSDVYIANVVKCRPPKNRNPAWDEMKVCGKFLERQIDIIRPRVIIALGKFSAMYLKGLRDVAPEAFPISKYRGRFEKHKGADLMLTYHPSYLLRNQGAKKDVWEDLQQVMKLLGLKHPQRDKG